MLSALVYSSKDHLHILWQTTFALLPFLMLLEKPQVPVSSKLETLVQQARRMQVIGLFSHDIPRCWYIQYSKPKSPTPGSLRARTPAVAHFKLHYLICIMYNGLVYLDDPCALIFLASQSPSIPSRRCGSNKSAGANFSWDLANSRLLCQLTWHSLPGTGFR